MVHTLCSSLSSRGQHMFACRSSWATCESLSALAQFGTRPTPQRLRKHASSYCRRQLTYVASAATKPMQFPRSSDRCNPVIFSSTPDRRISGLSSSSAAAFSTTVTNSRRCNRRTADGALATAARIRKTEFNYSPYHNEYPARANPYEWCLGAGELSLLPLGLK